MCSVTSARLSEARPPMAPTPSKGFRLSVGSSGTKFLLLNIQIETSFVTFSSGIGSHGSIRLKRSFDRSWSGGDYQSPV